MHPAMQRTTIAPFMRGNMGIPALTGFGSLAGGGAGLPGGGAGGHSSGGQQTSMGSPSSLQQTSQKQARPSQRSHVGESGCERPRIASEPSAVLHHPSPSKLPLGSGHRHMSGSHLNSQPDLNPRPCFVSLLSTATPGMRCTERRRLHRRDVTMDRAWSGRLERAGCVEQEERHDLRGRLRLP